MSFKEKEDVALRWLYPVRSSAEEVPPPRCLRSLQGRWWQVYPSREDFLVRVFVFG